MDILAYNRDAWNRMVAAGNRWTVPVTSDEIADARRGEWSIVLTPCKPVPCSWFPDMRDLNVLALASGGGQQGPILAAAGAQVTVLDNSPAQLARDREVADREGLPLTTVQGDMANLGEFESEFFDLVVHPCSNCFVPDVRPVWREAFRVLRHGGALLSGFCDPVLFAIDRELEKRGIAQLKHVVPYSDVATLTDQERRRLTDAGEPLVFGHTLEDQIRGQTDVGFLIAGFYGDKLDDGDLVSRFLPCVCATRALKP